jgi:hypothetical protein
MIDLLEEFRQAIPANRKLGPGGWLNFNCPSCGDRTMRGGVLFTATGGWRYNCFNGGCDFNTNPSGWEPGNGFGGRPRRVFEMIGGDVRRIPLQEIMKWNSTTYTPDGRIEKQGANVEVVHQFPETGLPKGSMPLLDIYQSNKTASKIMAYAVARFGKEFIKKFPFQWSEEHPYYLILPYFHYQDKIVGYLGRHIYVKSGGKRFIQRAPGDYLYNQHLLSSYTARYLFVVESPMDAVQLGCVAARNDTLTKKQLNLLRVSGKDIVMVPDFKKGEWGGFLKIAQDNNWFMSIPKWPGNSNPESMKTTDIGQSIIKNGLLYTIDLLMKATTRNFKRAEAELIMRSV